MIELEVAEHAKAMQARVAAALSDNLRRFEEGMNRIAALSDTEASEESSDVASPELQAA